MADLTPLKGDIVTATAPRIEAANLIDLPTPRKVELEPHLRSHGMLFAFGIASLAVTGTLVMTIMLSWQPLQSLKDMNRRISALDGAEARLSQHMDDGVQSVVNHVESRISGLRSNMDGRFDQLDFELRGVDSRLTEVRHSMGEGVEMLHDTSARMDEALSAAVVEISQLGEMQVAARAAAKSKPAIDPFIVGAVPAGGTSSGGGHATPSSPEAAVARFQRVELPDGSVSYRIK
ncbi:hypothetical protein [Consotaella salsifontis]|uniref:Uncharacterized protein n=1 Tax=Consotaella salsifontis TaxID=1365950 RepID=A0A1T4PUY0_9HYPH|nr:hypothetical protein [Consotaella salsifontis]SJZ95354.1 hypothetical protein SAMN05428963_104180 [Consotaella salsifontis]